MKNRSLKALFAGMIAFFLCIGAFANVAFTDGSVSRTFPTSTLYWHKVWGKWTMDTYARISVSGNDDVVISGRTKLRSSRLQGFTGGVFVDLKDSRGNVIDRISSRTNRTASENENGNTVGWGVNGKSSRTVNWEVSVPSNIMYLVKSVDILEVRTPKKIEWGKAKDTFKKIASNLQKAIKNFFDNDGAKLITKYAPDFVRMNNEAKAGTLSFGEVLTVMNSVIIDAKNYGIISSAKAGSIVEIISAVSDIAENGKAAWNDPEMQKVTIAFMQNIVSIADGNITDSALLEILNQVEFMLNAGGDVTAEIMVSVETIVVESQNLLEGKLNQSQYAALNSFVEIIKQINDYQHPAEQKLKVNCAFDFTRMVIVMHSEAAAGSLTAEKAKAEIVGFLNTYHSVLGLSEVQNAAVENIINSVISIINSGKNGLLPADQEKLICLIVDIKKIAAEGLSNNAAVDKFVDDLESICESRENFVAVSFPEFVNIVENLQTVLAPKLKGNADEVFSNIIKVMNNIKAFGDEPVAKHLDVIFNGVRFVINLAREVQNDTVTIFGAVKQFNTYWDGEVYPILINAYPNNSEEINKLKLAIQAAIISIISQA